MEKNSRFLQEISETDLKKNSKIIFLCRSGARSRSAAEFLTSQGYESCFNCSVFSQFIGFNEIIENGYHFTGPTSTITTSFIFLIAFVHLVHVLAGILVLSFVIISNSKRKYSKNNLLGFELASIFWHFIDILWIYLFLFLVFFR